MRCPDVFSQRGRGYGHALSPLLLLHLTFTILLSAPFLKAKRALFFSKILYKYYGAELVVSEKHRSGALFHFVRAQLK